MKPCRYRFTRVFAVVIFLLCAFGPVTNSLSQTLNRYGVLSDNPYVVNRFVEDGKSIDEVIVPGRPPEIYRAPQAAIPEPSPAAGTNSLTNVPAFDWSYGCSATSAAMMFGYYDNNGYPNLYTGPTNGGVCPLTNSAWGTGECPLSATHNGYDGRAIKGHVDDYWIGYGSTADDPYIGNWTQHVQGECTGDYMGTNQSAKGNSDGSTTFYNNTDGTALYDYTGAEPSRRDGCHGMKLFFESRGYSVSSNYSQYIYGYSGNTTGFTFAQYKAEIDAGRPVLIQVEGHTMLGYGYNDTGTLIYMHDTWDYNSHSMTWGGTYSGMQHYGVTVFVPSSSPAPVVNSFGINSGAASTTSATVTLNNNVIESTPTQYMASESSSFTGASWLTYSTAPSFTLSSGYGTKTVYFKVKNGSGTQSSSVSDTIQYVAPTPVVNSFGINSGASSTTSATVTLNNNVIGSTPTQYMASESSSFSGASWLTYSTAPSFTLSSGYGTKTVYFKVRDGSGTQSSSVSDAIQYVMPTPVVSSFGINSGSPATASTTVTLNNTVTGSTPTEYMASESSFFSGASWLTYSTAPSFTLSSGYGTKTVYFKVRDGLGTQSSSVSDTIQYASSIPVVSSFSINGGAAATTSTTVTLNNSVTGSTPTQYMASESSSLTGASWLTYSTAPSFTLSSGYGTKTVYLKVKDASGTESATVSDTIEYKRGLMKGNGIIELLLLLDES